MTVSTTTNKVSFAGNGVTTVFAFAVKFFLDSDVRVILRTDSDGTEVLQVLTTDYTLTGAGDDDGGNVTMIVAPPSGKTLVIKRDVPSTQLTKFVENDKHPADAVEDQYDKNIMVIQELEEKLTRAAIFPETFAGTPIAMPEPVASTFLGWNAAADKLVNSAVLASPAISFPAGNGILVKDSATSAIARSIAAIANEAVITNADGTGGNPTVGIFAQSKPMAVNIGLAAATTTTANDSIKITGANGSALSASNPGYVLLPSVTSGQLTPFTITADVTILLTGAHWGLGTFGNQTDYPLSVYALNNDGTLTFGVATLSGMRLFLGTDDSITPTDINLIDEILVKAVLTADAQALEVGWFKANFDDTGGAAEDLWAVQTADGDLNLGPCPSISKLWTPDGTWTTNTTYKGSWAKNGHFLIGDVDVSLAGTPTSASFSWNVPSGLTIDSAKLANNNASNIGDAYLGDTGTAANRTGGLLRPDVGDATIVEVLAEGADFVSELIPFTWASGDTMHMKFRFPIVGWDV